MSTTKARLSEGAQAREFILAGSARVTLVSGKTGTRFTYWIQKGKKDGSPHFVKLLNGPENTTDYVFLGTIFSNGDFGYHHGRKSVVGYDAPSAKTWAWAWPFLEKGILPPDCEVWHEGRCGRCSRVLTVPESIASGFGPECGNR